MDASETSEALEVQKGLDTQGPQVWVTQKLFGQEAAITLGSGDGPLEKMALV